MCNLYFRIAWLLPSLELILFAAECLYDEQFLVDIVKIGTILPLGCFVTCRFLTPVISALELNFNVMHYVNSRFTYLLTNLLLFNYMYVWGEGTDKDAVFNFLIERTRL